MHILVAFLFSSLSPTVFWMCAAGIVSTLIALWATRTDVAHARGLDKFVALANLCFAVPLAVFGAEHFTSARFIAELVPKYMPGRLFLTYLVGVALLAASLSIATRIQVRWSGLLFGAMMFLFVAMLDLPGTLANVHNRISWALLCREMSFGAGGWMLAAAAMDQRGQGKRVLITLSRLIIAIAAIFYGVEHFLHPLNVPGVPLEKVMPEWIPGRMFITYATGAMLVIAGILVLTGKRSRIASAYLGTWLLLVVIFIYGPILIVQLRDPNIGTQIEGINYFADTLLYAGTILALGAAIPRTT